MWVRKIYQQGREYWLKLLPEIISLRNQGLTFREIGKKFNCSAERIHRLLPVELRGGLKKLEMPKAPRYCQWCGKPLPKRRWKFCSDQCSKDRNSHKWKRYMTEEQKAHHKELAYKWREEHPERWREINREGQAAYQHRQKLKKKRGGICEAS